MTRNFIIVLVCSFNSVAINNCFADERDTFDRAYAAYQRYIDEGNRESALGAAEEAYRYGQKVFGKDNINTANLAFNYASLLNSFDRSEEAAPLLKLSLVILEDYHGDKSPRLADALFELAKASWHSDSEKISLNYLDRAVEVSASRPWRWPS